MIGGKIIICSSLQDILKPDSIKNNKHIVDGIN